MSTPINYRKNVNQQLAGASFQLSLVACVDNPLSKIQRASCIQAVIHHLVLTVENYINEILISYKRDSIDFVNTNIAQLFDRNGLQEYDIVELNEWQQWYEKTPLFFHELINFKAMMLISDQSTTDKKTENLIVVVSEVNNNIFSNTSALTKLKQEMVSLIDRQRESLLEH